MGKDSLFLYKITMSKNEVKDLAILNNAINIYAKDLMSNGRPETKATKMARAWVIMWDAIGDESIKYLQEMIANIEADGLHNSKPKKDI